MLRLRDILVSSSLLVLFSPLLTLLAFLIYWRIGSPIMFCQLRPGRAGKLFNLYKFRSMTERCDASGNLLPDEQRLTGFGRLLRSTSLDEIPTLINVLRGEMSLVGPRPLLVRYLPLYSAYQARRHEVLPGITGWAQVNGRNAISWEQKFTLDVWYVDNRSFKLDCIILMRTITKVLKRSDISAKGMDTMKEFTGSQE